MSHEKMPEKGIEADETLKMHIKAEPLKISNYLEALIDTINDALKDQMPGLVHELEEIQELTRRKDIALAPEKHFTPVPCDFDILGGRNMVQYALDNASSEELPNINEFPDFFEIPERLKQTNASSEELRDVLAHLEVFSDHMRVGSYGFKAKMRYTNALIHTFGSFPRLNTDDSQKDYHLAVFLLYEASHNINAGLVSAKLIPPPKSHVCYLGDLLQECQNKSPHEISEDDFKSLVGITDYFDKRTACIDRQAEYYEQHIDYLEEIRKITIPALSALLFNDDKKHKQAIAILELILNTVSGTYNYIAGLDKNAVVRLGNDLMTTTFKGIDFTDPDIAIATNNLRDFYSLRLGIHTSYQLKQGWLLQRNTLTKYIENHNFNKELDLKGRIQAAFLADAFYNADLDVKSLNVDRCLELTHRPKEKVAGANYTDINLVMADHMPCAKTAQDCLNKAMEFLPSDRSPCMLEDTRVLPGEDIVSLRKKAGRPRRYVKLDDFHGAYNKIYKSSSPMLKRAMSQTTKALKRCKKHATVRAHLSASLSVAMVEHLAFWGTASQEYGARRYNPLVSDE